MRKFIFHTWFVCELILPLSSLAQDSLNFSGQASLWTLYNESGKLPLYTGGRYLPQIYYSIPLKDESKIDFDGSVNINGSAGFHPFDSMRTSGQLKPYRLWFRYSSPQFEIRAGLQKINFGSASLLRPLMWFDEVDPRDPLKLTDGVWGVLGRYYFLNNANIWLWGLYGNRAARAWDLGGTSKNIPEAGGRLQLPVPSGEAAISFHHRMADTRGLSDMIPAYSKIPENRIGFDIRLDLIAGIWFEGSWINKRKDIGIFTNQEILNLGLDYTFGIGNGLYAIFEQLLVSNDKDAFRFENPATFSLFSLSYPIGLFDNISGIIYYDWKNENIYSFINWQKQFNIITIYFMGFWNPDRYYLPAQGGDQNLFAGKGIQIMLVLNH
jgi:hypothetical protein